MCGHFSGEGVQFLHDLQQFKKHCLKSIEIMNANLSGVTVINKVKVNVVQNFQDRTE